jgi:endoglucanase
MTLFTLAPRLRSAAPLLALLASACADTPTGPGFTEDSDYAFADIGNVEIVAPVADATVTGLTTFTARLTDRPLDSYKMTWRVDNGTPVRMTRGSTYHAAPVDVSSWSWNGTGPYRVTFIARQVVDGVNTIVGKRTVNIYMARSANPFAAAKLYVDPYSNAKKTANGWRASRPADAAQMDKIASQPQADWFGGWLPDIYQAVNARTTTITNAGALPVFVAYNIPFRDCGGYSSGGAAGPDAYRTWITNFASGIGARSAIVILEPDALAGLSCLSAADQQTRMQLIAYAVQVLKARSGISVYIDAGHSGWQSAATMIARLKTAGIESADGFSLNVSNFIASSEARTYGELISAGVGGKHFVIDTSRNGQGANGEWCNPTGRGIGANPTANTGAPLVDAFLWIKRPGESDGSCSGGPAAGKWWAESADASQAHALGLARRSTTMVAFN